MFKYLKSTTYFCLSFKKQDQVDEDMKLIGFVHAYFTGDLDKMISPTRYVFTLFGCPISWKASIQPVVALSTIEVEFIAITKVVKEVIWLKGSIKEIGVDQSKVIVSCDNQSTIHLTSNNKYHE